VGGGGPPRREKEGEADLKKAAFAQPDQVESLALLVRFLGGERHPEQILDLTREAVHKFPKDLSLRIERAKAFEVLGKIRKNAASIHLNRVGN